MTIQAQPTTASTSIGGTVDLPESACSHEPARFVDALDGRAGHVGHRHRRRRRQDGPAAGRPVRVPRLERDRGRHNESIVASINDGRAHVAEEPGLAERVAAAHTAGLLRATTDGGVAARTPTSSS